MISEVQSRRSAVATAELVQGAATGDRQAWEELVGRYTGMLHAITSSYRLDPSVRGDVAQTTWLRLIEHLDTLRDPGAVGTWLATTAHRECRLVVQNRRRERPGTRAEDLDTADCDRSPEDEAVARDQDARIRAAFRRLSTPDRRLLAYLMNSPRRSYADTSARLGMPVGSIGPTRARCLDRLRRELVAVGIDSC
jgi:RNA polymerase sigma factor (sigma-70 family)